MTSTFYKIIFQCNHVSFHIKDQGGANATAQQMRAGTCRNPQDSHGGGTESTANCPLISTYQCAHT